VKIEILGAGGAGIVPRPFCVCQPCREAREKGAPYTRYGPAIFIHDIELLIDTPEEISYQLTRSNISRVAVGLYSHWHPDHTAGVRVWEHNHDPNRTWDLPPNNYCTPIFLPEIVAKTFLKFHDLMPKLRYLEQLGVVHLNVIPDGAAFTVSPIRITPFMLAEDYVCGFLFEDTRDQKRVLICMDELYDWTPPAWLGKLDLAIIPAGMFEIHPLTGQRVVPADHPILKREATFPQTLEMIRQLDTRRIVYVHLNESDRLTFDEYRELARRVNDDPENGIPPVEFAYDTMLIRV
jgi:phosphoribosyl 1,2-cyclic phosphate phosphodiesterase